MRPLGIAERQQSRLTSLAASAATTCAGSSPTGNAFSYDNEGRLASWQSTPTTPLQSASFLYDGEGQRVAQVATAGGGATTTTSYVGSLEEVTSSGSGTTTTAYYGSGLAESVNGTLSYLLSDGLGSVSASVNASGTVTASQLYGPYGGVRYSSGTLPTSYGYTRQRSDVATSGLDYYGARYYDPVAGQFTSTDPLGSAGIYTLRYGQHGTPPSAGDTTSGAPDPSHGAPDAQQDSSQNTAVAAKDSPDANARTGGADPDASPPLDSRLTPCPRAMDSICTSTSRGIQRAAPIQLGITRWGSVYHLEEERQREALARCVLWVAGAPTLAGAAALQRRLAEGVLEASAVE